jgi:hypothetical protein
MTAPAASARFAHHVATARFADLPASAAEHAKTFILDTIGVGIAGSTADGAAVPPPAGAMERLVALADDLETLTDLRGPPAPLA